MVKSNTLRPWQSAGASNQNQEHELSIPCETGTEASYSAAYQPRQEQERSVEESNDSSLLVSRMSTSSNIHVSGSIKFNPGPYHHHEDHVNLPFGHTQTLHSGTVPVLEDTDSSSVLMPRTPLETKPDQLSAGAAGSNYYDCGDDIRRNSELAEINWEERLSVSEEGLKGFVPQGKYSWTPEELSTVKSYCEERVGLLLINGILKSFGTFSHLGNGYGLTCWHCCEAEVNDGKGVWKSCKVKFVLPDKRVMSFDVEREIPYVNQANDVVVLKLCPNKYDYPPPFDEFEFSNTSDKELRMLIAGFQIVDGSKKLVLGRAVKLKKLPKKDVDDFEKTLEQFYGAQFRGAYSELEKPQNEWLISKLIDGASGGAGVTINQDNKVVLHLMYKNGYPGAFYDPSFSDRKKEFCARYLVETGIKVKNVISDFPADLITKIFQ